ncbi:MAG TPA: fused MFS/spermidine synthase [Verrucomicrobiae bacterium]|jgi:predicted membrane-bound spermidine synthase|nr:fused MFS/spermidine synthase [Verrucomicrobiae bacterium]
MQPMAILILFFCSGATALVYEVVWSKYLALLFGSTIQAQTVVLAVFMGGLAVGNKAFGRFADRTRHPLRLYGCLEVAIGVYAFLFSLLYRAADAIFASVGSMVLDRPVFLLLLKGALSIALLLGPTILMGGTFPILAAWLQKNTMDAGRVSARFYSINSLGAVFGAGLTGFWLVEWLGLRTTMDFSALVNVAIGLAAIAIGTTHQANATATNQSSGPPPANGQSQAPAAIFRLACIMVALTGGVSMGLEVLASRCLCLIFGASLQVFSIVLMAFILGIGIGSSIVASPRFKRLHGETTAVFLMLGASLLIGLVVFNIENLVAVYLTAETGLSRSLMGYRYHQMLAAIMSICVLGLPAGALGAVLPLSIRIASETSDLLGDRVGRLVTWNTLGAVVGSLLTGFVLMPEIGLRGSFTTLAVVLALVGIWIAIARCRPSVVAAGAAVALFVIITSFHGSEGWRYIFSAGIFRPPKETGFSMAELLGRTNNVQLEFYEDAADATVSVERFKNDNDFALRIDGKVDASAKGDAATQLLLAYLPLMANPGSKDVFCFGMGSGITAGATLNYPIDHLTVAENCAPVLRAARLFDPWNNGVLTNSRARIYHEDARTVMKLSPQKYDVIISEPSNPWMVGVASVFTREFYQSAASHLKPGGIIAQWFHSYEMDDRNVDVVLRTFGSVFHNMEIWDVDFGDIVLLGSEQPWRSDTIVYGHAFDLEGVRKRLATIGLKTPEEILARRMASQRTAFAIAGSGPLQADDTPFLEYAAPRTFYLRLHTSHLQGFDERTWQMDLASDKVNNELAKLDVPALESVFGRGYGSFNDQLLYYLQGRFAKQAGRGAGQPVIVDHRAMLCSLQGTNKNFGIYTPPSAATNMISRELAAAEYGLRGDAAQQSAAIDTIQSVLDSLPQYVQRITDWTPAYYADLAIKASLRASNPERAKMILLRGLQLEPNSEQLGYLSRIFVREGILQPGEMLQFATK